MQIFHNRDTADSTAKLVGWLLSCCNGMATASASPIGRGAKGRGGSSAEEPEAPEGAHGGVLGPALFRLSLDSLGNTDGSESSSVPCSTAMGATRVTCSTPSDRRPHVTCNWYPPHYTPEQRDDRPPLPHHIASHVLTDSLTNILPWSGQASPFPPTRRPEVRRRTASSVHPSSSFSAVSSPLSINNKIFHRSSFPPRVVFPHPFLCTSYPSY